MEPARDEYVTTGGVAEMCGVTRQTVYRWIHDGKVTPDQVLSRNAYFTVAHAEAIADAYRAALEAATWKGDSDREKD